MQIKKVRFKDLFLLLLEQHKNNIFKILEVIDNSKNLDIFFKKINQVQFKNPSNVLINYLPKIWLNNTIQTFIKSIQEIIFYWKIRNDFDKIIDLAIIYKQFHPKNQTIEKLPKDSLWLFLTKFIWSLLLKKELEYDDLNKLHISFLEKFKNDPKLYFYFVQIYSSIYGFKQLKKIIINNINYEQRNKINFIEYNKIEDINVFLKKYWYLFELIDFSIISDTFKNYLFFYKKIDTISYSNLDINTKIPNLETNTLENIISEDFPIKNNFFSPKVGIITLQNLFKTSEEVQNIFYRILNEKEISSVHKIQPWIQFLTTNFVIDSIPNNIPLISRFPIIVSFGENIQKIANNLKDDWNIYFKFKYPYFYQLIEHISKLKKIENYYLQYYEHYEFPSLINPRKIETFANKIEEILSQDLSIEEKLKQVELIGVWILGDNYKDFEFALKKFILNDLYNLLLFDDFKIVLKKFKEFTKSMKLNEVDSFIMLLSIFEKVYEINFKEILIRSKNEIEEDLKKWINSKIYKSKVFLNLVYMKKFEVNEFLYNWFTIIQKLVSSILNNNWKNKDKDNDYAIILKIIQENSKKKLSNLEIANKIEKYKKEFKIDNLTITEQILDEKIWFKDLLTLLRKNINKNINNLDDMINFLFEDKEKFKDILNDKAKGEKLFNLNLITLYLDQYKYLDIPNKEYDYFLIFKIYHRFAKFFVFLAVYLIFLKLYLLNKHYSEKRFDIKIYGLFTVIKNLANFLDYFKDNKLIQSIVYRYIRNIVYNFFKSIFELETYIFAFTDRFFAWLEGKVDEKKFQSLQKLLELNQVIIYWNSTLDSKEVENVYKDGLIPEIHKYFITFDLDKIIGILALIFAVVDENFRKVYKLSDLVILDF